MPHSEVNLIICVSCYSLSSAPVGEKALSRPDHPAGARRAKVTWVSATSGSRLPDICLPPYEAGPPRSQGLTSPLSAGTSPKSSTGTKAQSRREVMEPGEPRGKRPQGGTAPPQSNRECEDYGSGEEKGGQRFPASKHSKSRVNGSSPEREQR